MQKVSEVAEQGPSLDTHSALILYAILQQVIKSLQSIHPEKCDAHFLAVLLPTPLPLSCQSTPASV